MRRMTWAWSWTTAGVVLAMILGSLTVFVPAAEAGAATAVSNAYAPLTPTRVLDTRTSGVRAAGSTTNVTLTGRAGVPSGATAVVLNVTAVSPASSGFLTVFPAGGTRPTASNLNFAASQTIANQVIATVGASGAVTIYTSARTNVLVDVAGYFPGTTSYDALRPTRVLDTRSATTHPAAGSVTTAQLTGPGVVPATGVAAVVLNVTAVNPAAGGFLTVYPSGTLRPASSDVNGQAGRNTAGLVVTPLGGSGSVDLYSSSATNLLVDVLGWIPTGSSYLPVPAKRLLDTRTTAPVAAGGMVKVPVGGRAGLPASGVTSVELNVTAVRPEGDGFLTTYPTGPRPTASTVNFQTGRTVANSVTAKVGSDGFVDVYASTTTQVIVDVVGFTIADGAPAWSAPRQVMQTTTHVTGISCGGTSLCGAVDQGGILAVYDGTNWQPGVFLDTWTSWTAISCVGATLCVAVGTRPVAPSGTDAVAATYDGAGWSGPTVVVPHGTLEGISCPTTVFCMATGEDTSSDRGVSVRLDGASWSTPTVAEGAPLRAASCVSKDFCVAGDDHGGIVMWNAGTWSPMQQELPDSVDSISCVSTTFCMAVGDGETVFDGTGWTRLASPSIFHPRASCAAESRCLVVGEYGATCTYTNWSFSPVRYLEDTRFDADMTAVSCTAVDVCAIADNNRSGSVALMLTADGSSRQVVLTIGQGQLTSVSCPTTAFCATDDRNGHVVTTSGDSWTTPTNLGSSSQGLSCPTAAFCVVSGRGDGAMMTLRDGSWSAVPYGRPTSDVSCSSAVFCAAIGFDSLTRFDGTRWALPTRLTSEQNGIEVSCVSPTFCVAVVLDRAGGSSSETWNGTSWSAPVLISATSVIALSCAAVALCTATDAQGQAYRLTSAGWGGATQVTDLALVGVSCPSSTWCMAVDRTGGTYEWDGAVWSVAGTGPGDRTVLHAISCAAVRRCIAVGDSALVRTYG